MISKKNTFAAIHDKKQGKASDKWESYLEFYDELFTPLKKNPITMLEIGVQNGGSLETYAEYFTKGKKFVGCDINERCRNLSYEDERIAVVVGNANTEAAASEILQYSNDFSIIIDDGSHVSLDIINSFLIYFPALQPGGIYVIEDTHTLYHQAFGGGITNERSAIAFFKKLVDVVSFEWWHESSTLQTHLSTFFLQSIPEFITDGWIESVEFRNSVIVIRKSKKAGHNKLGQRIIRGTDFSVNPLDSAAIQNHKPF